MVNTELLARAKEFLNSLEESQIALNETFERFHVEMGCEPFRMKEKCDGTSPLTSDERYDIAEVRRAAFYVCNSLRDAESAADEMNSAVKLLKEVIKKSQW